MSERWPLIIAVAYIAGAVWSIGSALVLAFGTPEPGWLLPVIALAVAAHAAVVAGAKLVVFIFGVGLSFFYEVGGALSLGYGEVDGKSGIGVNVVALLVFLYLQRNQKELCGVASDDHGSGSPVS